MLIPSIDLLNGHAVQLEQGTTKRLEHPDPLALAREFGRLGEIAVIDLAAAFEQGDHRTLIDQICKLAPCRVGGGIRSVETASDLIARGAVRIMVGTRVFQDNTVDVSFLKALKEKIGKHRIIVALDVRGDRIVIRGWKQRTALTIEEILPRLEPHIGGILYTNVDREGTLSGADIDRVRDLRNRTDLRITVAGGIHSSDEIRTLSQLGVDVQIGMALYTGTLPLMDAFLASLQWQNQRIPTVAVDPAHRLLMVGWSSPEAIRKTVSTGRLWFWSRSRQQLWQKGETSGNVLHWKAYRPDCDGDVLMAVVEPTGPVCHTDDPTCFGDLPFHWPDLHAIIRHRLDHPTPDSYTASLDDVQLIGKLREELEEMIEASEHAHRVWEVADVIYFLTVFMQRHGITHADVFHELRRRHYA